MTSCLRNLCFNNCSSFKHLPFESLVGPSEHNIFQLMYSCAVFMIFLQKRTDWPFTPYFTKPLSHGDKGFKISYKPMTRLFHKNPSPRMQEQVCGKLACSASMQPICVWLIGRMAEWQVSLVERCSTQMASLVAALMCTNKFSVLLNWIQDIW